MIEAPIVDNLRLELRSIWAFVLTALASVVADLNKSDDGWGKSAWEVSGIIIVRLACINDGYMDGWVLWMDGGMHEWVDGWMGGWVDN
jgi:hypothetical protein